MAKSMPVTSFAGGRRGTCPNLGSANLADSDSGSEGEDPGPRPSFARSKTLPAVLRAKPTQKMLLGRVDTYLDLDMLLNLGDEDEDDDEDGGGAVVARTQTRRKTLFCVGGDEEEETKDTPKIPYMLALTCIVAMCVGTMPFELLNKMDRGSADLIFFAQVTYAAVECLLCGGVRGFLFDRKIPLGYHLCTLTFELGRNQLYNIALGMGLPMPVYLVLKNSGLVVSMSLGWLVQQKKYSLSQVLGVLVITLGVLMSTFASRPAAKDTQAAAALDHHTFMLATAAMVAGVVTTSAMNVVQERAFQKHGKHFQESMFFANILMLPVLCCNGPKMLSHARTWTGLWSQPLSVLNISLPYMWILLLFNIVSQSVMKVSCMKLTATSGQVSNVVSVTVARFSALALSALALNSPPFPPISFWVGGILVLGGTLAYVLAATTTKASRKKGQ